MKKLFKLNYYKNIYKLYIIIFFHNLIPAYVIERLFWQERGMNIQMVIYCEIIYGATVILCEIPSGIMADKFGRKKLMIVGAVCACLEFAILIFAYSFWQFALVVFIAGIGTAVVSGTSNALIYESLSLCKKEKDFEKVLGRYNSIDFLSGTIAALSGSVMAVYLGFEFNYFISLSSTILAFVITLTLIEVKSVNNDEYKKLGFVEYLVKSLRFFRNNLSVCFIVINSMIIMACINYLDEFWQIYLGEISFPIILFGVFSAVLTIIKIPGAIMAGFLIKHIKVKMILLFTAIFTAMGLLMAAIFKNYFGMLGMVVACIAIGIIEPIVTGVIQHKADNETRATIDSFQSLAERLFSIIIGLIFGYIATVVNIFTGYLLLGIICIVIFILYLGFYRRISD